MWALNLGLVGVPWIFFSAAMVAWNLFFNISLNKFWAGGNFFLIFNTIYAVTQTIMSIPLVCEFPLYLRHLKFFRVLSLISAVFYSSITIFIFVSWLVDLYGLPEILSKEDFNKLSFLDMFVNMCMIYNTILHSSIVPINVMIIAKEI